MKVLILGANGATGKHAVEQCTAMGLLVKAMVRSKDRAPESWNSNPKIEIVEASIADISVQNLSEIMNDCDGAISCLGHNLNFKGIYGKPRKLVAHAIEKVVNAFELQNTSNAKKVILMNTTGNINKAANEKVTLWERMVIGFIRVLLPPQTDNEAAAKFLSTKLGTHQSKVEWVAVRPDSLVDENAVSDYSVVASPTRSAIFNAGKTSRINVGHFMATLLTYSGEWLKWKAQMPVIYNN